MSAIDLDVVRPEGEAGPGRGRRARRRVEPPERRRGPPGSSPRPRSRAVRPATPARSGRPEHLAAGGEHRHVGTQAEEPVGERARPWPGDARSCRARAGPSGPVGTRRASPRRRGAVAAARRPRSRSRRPSRRGRGPVRARPRRPRRRRSSHSSPATRSASRVLPTPPGPVSVTSRCDLQARRPVAPTSSVRPTNFVVSAGSRRGAERRGATVAWSRVGSSLSTRPSSSRSAGDGSRPSSSRIRVRSVAACRSASGGASAPVQGDDQLVPQSLSQRVRRPPMPRAPRRATA